MSQSFSAHQFIETSQLSVSEQNEINSKVELKIVLLFHRMAKLGAVANILVAFFYVLTIYHTTKPILLVTWYCTLVIANLFYLVWAIRFKYSITNHESIVKYHRVLLYIAILICVTWSNISILFSTNEIHQQTMTIIFLSVVLICFPLTTALDLKTGITSIVSLMAPTILYNFYLMTYSVHDINYSLSLIASFLILGLFMLIACFVENRVILKIFRLGYEKALLSQKLENINSYLEQRVEERTKELETSLNLVTYQATHDLLTDLPNERLLYESIHIATQRAVKNHDQFAIACFSINAMSKIRDSIGHQALMTIIHRIAQRFEQLAEKNKIFFVSLSRQDIFVILIDPLVDIHEVQTYAQNLFTVIQDPIYVAKQELRLTASIGISVFPADGREVDSLITNAEAARVLASERGGNSLQIYNNVMNANAFKQLSIENQLYRAIEHNELILNYQPFIDLRTGTVCGGEALIRWNNPTLGLIPPLDFITIAETNGMIFPIGEWVLSTACRQLKIWHNNGFKELTISVNLSAKQLVQQNLVERIAEFLNTEQLEPQYLELELTESNAFQKDAIPIIKHLTEMGISLAIDDFGTGYSEFRNLKLFHVDKIKIDKTFIQDINISIDSRNIVCNTIALASRMGIKCLAEGVETEEQVNFLQENGCYLMQGFYYSKPLTAEEFFEFLKKHSESYWGKNPGKIVDKSYDTGLYL